MRLVQMLGTAVVIGVVIAGCGGSSGLSASSTCEDFSKASLEEQAEAISSLSSEFDTPEYASPLGSPEVGYYCSSNPETTLEALFKQEHGNETGEEVEEGGIQRSGGTEELSGVSEVEELLEGIPQKGLVLGQPNASVELIEFADLQCPVCKSTAEEELSQVIRTQISEGTAKLSFRNFVIIGPESTPAGAAALAAGQQGRGWNFIELFFRNQGTEASGYVTEDFLTEIAEAAGVPDIGEWNEARESPQLTQEVAATTKEANKFGFTGAPSFAVEGPATNGLELLGTPTSASELEQAITRASAQ